MQERTKWLAQDQEEELTKTRQGATGGLQSTGACNSEREKDCIPPQLNPSTTGGSRPGPQPGVPPAGNTPGGQNPPDLPNPGGNNLIRTQLTQPDQDFTTPSSQIPFASGYGSPSTLTSVQFESFTAFWISTGQGRHSSFGLPQAGGTAEPSLGQPMDCSRRTD